MTYSNELMPSYSNELMPSYSNEIFLAMVYIYITVPWIYYLMLEYTKSVIFMYNYGMLNNPIILNLLP